jgi:hypothetical protein
MLEGKEVDVKFDGDAGQAFVDVDMSGKVTIGASYVKQVDMQGYAQASANLSLSAETNIFTIAEKLVAKTGVTWDDALVQSLKMLLGVQAPPPAPPAPPAA